MTAGKNLIQAAAGNVGGGFYDYEIANSARFAGAETLYRTQGTPTNNKKWTFSCWYKYTGPPDSWKGIIGAGTGGSDYTNFYLNGNHFLLNHVNYGQMDNTRDHRDPGGWLHVVVAFDSTQASAGDRQKIYVNSDKEGQPYSYGSWPQNFNTNINKSGYTLYIGRSGETATYSKQYLAECVFIDGQQLDPTSFAEEKNGVWIPKEITGLTFGNNGFHLKFDNASSLGTDSSGNSNDFTASGLASSDQMLDTPTNNFCTWSPIGSPIAGDFTLANGNLEYTGNTQGAGRGYPISTFGAQTSGSWYWEVYMLDNQYTMTGVSYDNNLANADLFPGARKGVGYYGGNGNKYVDNASTAYGATFTSGDIIGVHLDIDGGQITYYKNGSSQGAITLPSAGEEWYPAIGDGSSTPIAHAVTNFGQDGTFAGNTTAGGNSDANGLGDFKYAVPTGALALCTSNLPEPTIGPNSDTLSGENFNTVLWTGTGSTNNITGVGFQPDWVWIKNRSAAQNHVLHDAVRGAGKYLMSDSTSAEATNTNQLSSFDSDGFTVGTAISTNQSGSSFVGWNWKANGSGVTNTDGSITSTVSANQDAGFSIVTYTGTGTASAETIGHGLGVAPKVVITKTRDATPAYNWNTYHYAIDASAPEDYFVALNTTAAKTSYTAANLWNRTQPTSSVVHVNSILASGGSSDRMLFYCFAEVEGFSKFGKYTGNGSSDGPFVYTGFRPAFLMVKGANVVTNWWIMDDARDTYNGSNNKRLFADSSSAESANAVYFDTLSNGFKLRDSNANVNGSYNYIYMAFAENPFKYSNAR